MGTTKIIKSTRGYTLEGDPVDLNVHRVDGLHVYDGSSSGYIRIGSLQICWGVNGYSYRGAGDYFLDITLPKSFLNGGIMGYTIVATLADYQLSGLGYAVGDQGNEPPGNRKTTTGFRIRWHQNSNMASAIEWIAIGRWK